MSGWRLCITGAKRFKCDLVKHADFNAIITFDLSGTSGNKTKAIRGGWEYQVQESWLGMALMGGMVVVGLLAGVLLSKSRGQKNASIVAFISLALLLVAFYFVVICYSVQWVVPLFIIAFVLLPIALYSGVIALSSRKPSTQKSSSSLIPKVGEAKTPVRSATPSKRPAVVTSEAASDFRAASSHKVADEPLNTPAEKAAATATVDTKPSNKPPMASSDAVEAASSAAITKENEVEKSTLLSVSPEKPATPEVDASAKPAAATADSKASAAKPAVVPSYQVKGDKAPRYGRGVRNEEGAKPAEQTAAKDKQPSFAQSAVEAKPAIKPAAKPTPEPVAKPADKSQSVPVASKSPQKPSSVAFDSCFAKAEALKAKGVYAVASRLYAESAQLTKDPSQTRKALFEAMGGYIKADMLDEAKKAAVSLQSAGGLNPVETMKVDAVLRMA